MPQHRCPRLRCGVIRVLSGCLALLALAATSSALPRAQAQSASDDTVHQYFFLIDASGSMVGLPRGGGNPVIFPKVKDNVNALIASLEPGTDVYVIPFHRGVQEALVLRRSIRGDSDRRTLKEHVSKLRADGQVTWIYRSLAQVLEMVEAARKPDPEREYVQTIYLFTDGEDNSPAGVDLQDILRRFRMQRSDNPYLFLKYITLGTSSEPAWGREPGVEVQANPPAKLRTLLSVRVSPPELDFGNMRETGRASRRVTIAFDPRLRGTRLRAVPYSQAMETKGATPRIKPEVFALPGQGSALRQELTLFVEDAGLLAQSAPFDYEGEIRFHPVDSTSDVDFSPDAIGFSAGFAPVGIVTLSSDQGALSRSLGRIDPYARAYSPYALTVIASFNDHARSSKASVHLSLEAPDETLECVRFEGATAVSSSAVLTGDEPRVSLLVDPPQGIPPGDYRFNVVVSTDAGRIEGEGLEGGGDSPEPTHFVITFSVAPTPPPLWKSILLFATWAAVLLAVAFSVFVLGLSFISRRNPIEVIETTVAWISPKIEDATIIIECPEGSGDEEVVLAGLRRFERLLEVGGNGGDLRKVKVRFVPHVSLTTGSRGLAVVVDDPRKEFFAEVTRSDGEAVSRGSVEVFDGDEIAIGTWRIRAKSFSYVR